MMFISYIQSLFLRLYVHSVLVYIYILVNFMYLQVFKSLASGVILQSFSFAQILTIASISVYL